MVPTMDISLFDYELDSNLIAQNPCVPRDNSRLFNCTKDVAETLHSKTAFLDMPAGRGHALLSSMWRLVSEVYVPSSCPSGRVDGSP